MVSDGWIGVAGSGQKKRWLNDQRLYCRHGENDNISVTETKASRAREGRW